MKTHRVKIFIVTLGLVIVGCLTFIFASNSLANKTNTEMKTAESSTPNVKDSYEIEKKILAYDKKVSDFKVISGIDLLNDNRKKSNILVYFGRRTCPYCREFVPNLHDEVKKTSLTTYYFDTENTDKIPEKQQVRGKLGVKFVPSLLYFKSDGSIEKYNPKNQELHSWIMMMERDV